MKTVSGILRRQLQQRKSEAEPKADNDTRYYRALEQLLLLLLLRYDQY